MKPLILALNDGDPTGLTAALAHALDAESGTLETRRFPDGETYLRVHATAAQRDVVIAGSLDRPDDKLVRLYLLASTLRDLGARRVLLAAPYLAYMRQDRTFHEGEGVSARYVAGWLSGCLDGLVTVDPHLHRIHTLDEVYRCPSRVVAAAPAIAAWIAANVDAPLLLGPDAESEQWVVQVAELAHCPYVVLEKQRHGDRDVEVSVPQVERWREHTPVLIDDIVSTARTMIATVRHLQVADLPAPVCVAVHAIFADTAYHDLLRSGARRVVTCNSIAHPSNLINLHPRIADALHKLLRPDAPFLRSLS
ncbi:MAG: ribose-phosphate diphosphokinase [Nevskiales bacterium]|nr:ribose-phosphate diphosphokinase [Nevskiales bacterium]